MEKEKEKTKDKRTETIILILLTITLIAVGVTIWAVFFREEKSPSPEETTGAVLVPDYAPKELESNAEPMTGDDEKMSMAEGGGAVSLTYSKNVSISLSDKSCSLLFGNPGKSNQDMIVQIIIKNQVIAQSGRLTPGNQVTRLNITDDAADMLSAGGYEGCFSVLYYQQDTGEKAIVNTEIPITIEVTE